MASPALSLLLVLSLGQLGTGSTPLPQTPRSQELKQLTLEELSNVEVTTASKEPEPLRQTPAAIYALTQDDIRRSGATSIPEVLRLVPGVEVARIDSNKWAIGVRGFGTRLSKSVLVAHHREFTSDPGPPVEVRRSFYAKITLRK